jgi:octaheme c-type cytochrome (tetrathionate reductase family)
MLRGAPVRSNGSNLMATRRCCMPQEDSSVPRTDPQNTAKSRGFSTIVALGIVALTLATSVALTGQLDWTHRDEVPRSQPRQGMPPPRSHTEHKGFYKQILKDGPSVTKACLECHPQAAAEVMHTQHFTWLGSDQIVPGSGPGHTHPQRIGKRNLLNNFCLSVESNWPRCTNCHAGYGWVNAQYDFSKPTNVDCLICHDGSGTYVKASGGLPAPGVDLLQVAESVGRPSRTNCGSCHFAGGGGDAVKHGDLDATLNFPQPRNDVHMGKANMVCVDCHRAQHHQIPGQAMSVSVGEGQRVACTDCHAKEPHRDARLNQHTSVVACATCHIPWLAPDSPTKLVWDWSTAGRDTSEKNPHVYMKEKGSFIYQSHVAPEYYWYDGHSERYLKGDPVYDGEVVNLNLPLGARGIKGSLIVPFKVHRGKQPYDTQNKILLVAQTYGEQGYWTTYDWAKAIRLGSDAAGLPFSGNFGFIATRMYWPLSHMVAPAEHALGCVDCHRDGGRLDWQALGYETDPALRTSLAERGSP